MRLQTQRQASGEFKELGEVHHKDMQGGASTAGLPMTAYVIVSMLENGVRDLMKSYTNAS